MLDILVVQLHSEDFYQMRSGIALFLVGLDYIAQQNSGLTASAYVDNIESCMLENLTKSI